MNAGSLFETVKRAVALPAGISSVHELALLPQQVEESSADRIFLRPGCMAPNEGAAS